MKAVTMLEMLLQCVPQSIINKSKQKRKEYYIFTKNIRNNSNNKNQVRNDDKLPKGTIIKIGESIITGKTQEKKPGKSHNMKERP